MNTWAALVDGLLAAFGIWPERPQEVERGAHWWRTGDHLRSALGYTTGALKKSLPKSRP